MVFTGIVRLVAVSRWSAKDSMLALDVDESDIDEASFWADAAEGDSIAVDGVCLTLLEAPKDGRARFFVQRETLRCTTLGLRADGSSARCNVERALQASDRLSGHLVLGHVHGVAEVEAAADQPDGSRDVWVRLPPHTAAVEHKGSITLDGVSLTVAEKDDARVRVSLIPYTLNHTTLGTWTAGRKVNVEFDARTHAGASPERPDLRAAAAAADLDDEGWMAQAIACGEQGRPTAAPNPWVGCVIVLNGRPIGRGHHAKAGGPHAEVVAIVDALCSQYREMSRHEAQRLLLPEAGEDHERLLVLKGATAYVTLEPCVAHKGKRTAPCAPLLVRLGFSRVVVALEDPDKRVRGQGVALLREAGLQVDVGVGAKDAARSLRPYLKQRLTGLPHVVVKVACSLDGAIAAEDCTSKWITGPRARQHAHLHLRATSDAILIGSETALRDNPQLTVRHSHAARPPRRPNKAPPLRVVLDSRGRVLQGALLDDGAAPTLVVTTAAAPQSSRDRWRAAGVEVVELPASGPDGRPDVRAVLQLLGARGVLQVLVEGGPTLQSAFVRARLVDRLAFYVGGCLLGASAVSWARERLVRTMDQVGEAERWAVDGLASLGDDVFMEFVPKDGLRKLLGVEAAERLGAREADASSAPPPLPTIATKGDAHDDASSLSESPSVAAAKQRVARAVEAIRQGGIAIVMDDASRENEGDLVAAARSITADNVATMVRHTTGILCAPMPAAAAERLGLPPMWRLNEDEKQTAFTVSCDVVGSGTGVSAEHRAMTFRALASPETTADDLRRPGHVFPLVARPGGIHERPGHTEASVALCQLAGIDPPVAAIGELVMDSGRMARAGDVMAFAKEHGDLPVLTLDDLRQVLPAPPVATPSSPPCRVPVRRDGQDLGEWTCRVYLAEVAPSKRARQSFGHVVALTYGDGDASEKSDAPSSRLPPPLCRVHSECFTADVVGSLRCDCRLQLTAAMSEIRREGRGIVLYVTGHEGRGIGLSSKLAAYALMDHNKELDTYEANLELGFDKDERMFGGAAAALRAMGVTSVRLLSNNPAKAAALDAAGIRVAARVPIPVQLPPEAAAYFAAKRDRGGHDGSRVTPSVPM